MSVRVLSKVLRHSNETLARRLILIALADAASDDGVTWLAQETIAELARLSRTHVAECLREMATAGAIEVRKAQRGRRRTNVYRVMLSGLADVDYDRLPFTLDLPFGETVSESPTSSDGDRVGSADSAASESPAKNLASIKGVESPIEPSIAGANAPAAAPKLTRVDGRDVAFDALAEECHVDVGGNRAKEVATALFGAKGRLGIRTLFAREPRPLGAGPLVEGSEFEFVLAERIREQAQRYRDAMPGAILTPLALAKWWTDLAPGRGGTDQAADLFAEAQRLRDEEGSR